MAGTSGGVEGNLILNRATPAELTSLPTQSLRYYDFASVDSLKTSPGGALFFYDPLAVNTIDNVTVIGTKNGTGRWLSFIIYGGLARMLAVDTIALASASRLVDLDDSLLLESQTVYVRSVRTFFRLSKNIAGYTSDNITIATALSGGNARWLRQDAIDLSWNFQTVWYVDPVAGNDENQGNAPAAALKTVSEFSRRLTLVLQNTGFIVNILGDIPNTDNYVDRRRLFGGTSGAAASGSVITFQGQLVVSQAITLAAGSQQTLPTRAAATAQAEAVLGAGNWAAADVGKLIVDGAGNTAFVLSEKTLGANARVTDWIASNDTYAAAPVEGAATTNTLTKWRAPVVIGGNGISPQPTTAYAVSFRYLDFDDVGNNIRPIVNQGAVCFFSRCRISNANGGTALRFFAAGTFGFCQMTGCLVQNTSPISLASFTLGHANAPGLVVLWTFGNGFRNLLAVLSSSPNALLGACVQNGNIDCSSTTQFYSGPVHTLASTTTGQWVGVYNDFNTFATAIVGAVSVNAGARVRVEGSVYGTAVGTASAGGMSGLASLNGGVMWLPKNMDAAVTATKCFNLVPAGAGTEFYLDALATTVGSITNANQGAVLPVTAACTSFAQLIAAVPGGYARNMRNPANQGGFYQGL